MVAIITQDNVLLGDVSLQYLPDRIARPEENNIFKQAYFTSPKKYKGVVFNMLAGGGPIINYGHWLVDVLPRIYLLKKSGWFDRVDWFVVPNYSYDFQKDSLKLLGIDENRIIQGSDQLHITADVLIASTAPRGERSYLMPAWMVEFHRESFLNNQLVTNKFSPVVYISRRDGTTRKVLNEDKLIDLLEPYGFKAYELSKLSFIEKVNLFFNAKVILSVVGAGLSNVVYCRKEAKVIEIFPEVLVDTFNYNLVKSVGVDYYYLICKSETQAKKLTKANNTDLTVDLDQLKEVLDDVFEGIQKSLQVD
jgi:capsular polysaccharide biosynthesis protein